MPNIPHPDIKVRYVQILLRGFFCIFLVILLGFGLTRFVKPTEATGSSGPFAGCLKTSGTAGGFFGQFYNFADSTSPLLPCATDDLTISLGNGDITGVTAGTGLTGGGTSGDVTLSLGSTYQLPQSCSTDQIIKWNGSAWVCETKPPAPLAKVASVGGGNTQNTTSTSPVSLSGTTVSFSSGDIPVDSTLLINWSGRFNNNTAGLNQGIQTHVKVDGNVVVETHLSQAIAGGWQQHAANYAINVSAGSHTVEATWNVFASGTTGTSADTQMVVTAIPR